MLVSTAILYAFSCLATTVLTQADMRLWQTVYDRSAPLSWAWEDGTDSATLTFSNRVTKAVSETVARRTEGETRGVCASPAPQSENAIVDVSLVQRGGEAEVARATATLAYVSGVGGGPIVVRAKSRLDWRLVQEPRVFAFDPAWHGESGDSGYDVAWPNCKGFSIIIR